MPSLPSTADARIPDQSRAELALENVFETIAGNGSRLKGVIIASEVFDKTDPDEAQSTTIVRVEAGRLRRRLNDYYRGEGKNDPVQIRIPKGRYTATFEDVTDTTKGATVQSAETSSYSVEVTKGRVLMAAAIVFSLVAAFIYWNSDQIVTEENAPAQIPALLATKPIIAVMPFRNLVNDDPDDSIAFGLTEDIITDLGGLSTLEVISMTSVLPFKNLDINPLDISAKLGVHYVLNGSIRGSSPQLRVTAQLYDAINGVQLWAARFDRQMTNELALQDEISNQVVESLSVHLQGHENTFTSQRKNTDADTWSLYKQVMNLVNPPSDPARLELSLQAFEQIIQHDPNFAGGYAGAAYVHAFKVFFGHSRSISEDIHTAQELSELAQSLDPSFGLSYSAQAFAFLVNRDFEQALTASAQAVELSPNDPYVMAYHGFILCASGNTGQGIAFVETALRLDPLNSRTPFLNILGVINFQAGHYEAALQAFLRNQERGGPLGPGIHYFIAALGENIKATDTLAVADRMKNENYDWEAWVRRSWKRQGDVEHILNLVEKIRNQDVL
jgi:adenylate cyclase